MNKHAGNCLWYYTCHHYHTTHTIKNFPGKKCEKLTNTTHKMFVGYYILFVCVCVCVSVLFSRLLRFTFHAHFEEEQNKTHTFKTTKKI